MIDTIQISNYRCFKQLIIKDLGEVNVIVGENGAGKTALLESIFFPGCNPQTTLQLRHWRNLPPQPLVASKAGYEALWKDLFYQFSQNRIIELSLTGSPENTRSLKIYYKAPESVPLLPIESKDSSIPLPIIFETKDNGSSLYSQSVSIAGGIFQVQGPQPPNALISIYGVAPLGVHSAVAIQFSELSKHKREDVIIRALQKVFPQIKSLSIQTSGATPDIYCEVEELPEKIPLGLVSHGICKLLGILLHISSVPKGVCLIDEIENGFHFSVLPKMWEAIIQICKLVEVQLFVSTHSKECLTAMFDKNLDTNAFRLLKIDVDKDKNHLIRNFKGDELRAALETDVDPRL